MVFKHKNDANDPNNKWVMGLLSTLGVREFEPKCADPVSGENISITFYYTVTLLKMLSCNLLNDADVGNILP